MQVPSKGIACSNTDRATRLATEFLIVETSFRSSWGSQIWIGKLKEHEYGEEEVFVVFAPVGSGSGCLFSELYTAGAEYFVRCRSDDAKNPEVYEYNFKLCESCG